MLGWVNFGRRFRLKVGHFCTPIHRKEAYTKVKEQKSTFTKADFLFANGPYLQKALARFVNPRPVTRLVPGFPDIKSQTINDEIRAITFGRLDQQNDNIKQGLLAVAGFAGAVKDLEESSIATPSLKYMDKQIVVFGVNEPGGSDEARFRETAKGRAGKVINIIPMPFEDNRDEIFSALGEANIALMASWHEGFGLTGWESIAAEVPLILSKKSGLWLLIKEQFKCERIAEAYVRLVNIRGQEGEADSFTKNDEESIKDAVLGIATNLEDGLLLARELKEILQNKLVCTWEETAKQFLSGLGVSSLKESDPPEIKFVGKWTAYYIEGSMGASPNIVKEVIEITFIDGKLHGESEYEARKSGRHEVFSNLEVVDRLLMGESRVEGWNLPNGISRFQLVSNFEGNILDGVVSWVGGLTKQIDWSRYIWVRQGFNDPKAIEFVNKEMKIEKEVYNNRIRERYDFYQEK